MVEENDEIRSIQYIRDGMAELPVCHSHILLTFSDRNAAELGLGVWTDPRVHVCNTSIMVMGRCSKLFSSSYFPEAPLIKAQTANIRSKHGVILSCSLEYESSAEPKDALDCLAKNLEGQRYGFVEDSLSEGSNADERVGQVWNWLRAEINS